MPRSSLPVSTREPGLFTERGLSGWLKMLPIQPEAVALPADRIAFAPLGDLSAAPLVIAPAGAIPIALLLSSMLTHRRFPRGGNRLTL